MTDSRHPGPLDYERILAFVLHELRHIEATLDANATQLSIGIKGEKTDDQRIREYVPLVMEDVYALHTWLAVADYYLDPDQFAREPKQRRSLYQVFDKARINLRRRLKARQVSVSLRGEGDHFVQAHRIIGIVPFILFDNAIKYAPKGTAIEVRIEERTHFHAVSVSSVGPDVPEEEHALLFEPGYRGIAARTMSPEGNGLGLTLLQTILRYHDATASTRSLPPRYKVNGIECSNFEVQLLVPSD